MTLSEWMSQLTSQAGITEYQQQEPYFSTVQKDDPCYASVQAGVEWQIMKQEDPFDPEQPLNKEWAAYTVMNLIRQDSREHVEINDISDSLFPQQVNEAVSSSLMSLDTHHAFHPKQLMSLQDVEELLKQAVYEANHRTFDDLEPEYELNDSPEIIEGAPIAFDRRTLEGIYSKEKPLHAGDIIHWQDQQGNTYYYQISSMTEENGKVHFKSQEYDPSDHLESLQMSGSEELDFSKAVIQDTSGTATQEHPSYDDAQQYFHIMSMQGLTKEFSFQEYTVKINVNGSSLSARISREMPYGTEVSAGVLLNKVHVNYAWNSKKYDLKNAYFKMDFHSQEDLAVKNEHTKTLYGDLAKIDASSFLAKLKDLYQQKNDAAEKIITLCRITVPIPSAPVLNLDLSLQLHFSITGKAQLILMQDNGIGFETREGKIRIIKDSQAEAEAQLKASAKVLAGIKFGLNLMNCSVMDAGVNAGSEAVVKTTVHTYDIEGNMLDQITDVPGDVSEEMADGNPNVLVCTDVNAHWVANAIMNSDKTIAGKFGLSKQFDILDEDNAPLIPGLNHHFENGHAVDQCTRKSRKYLPSAEGITTSKRIRLKEYSFAVRKTDHHMIEIDSLPDGYTKNDLEYSSSDTDVITVDDLGCIFGKNAGSAVITIQTKDKKHVIHCNVIVPVS